MSKVYQYAFPTAIHSGKGARSELAAALTQNGCKKPLVVTDRDLAKLPPVHMVKTHLEEAALTPRVFDGLWGNPLKSQADAGVAAYKENDCDSIVAIGGGAALDVAKCIALMAHHEGDLLDYEDGKEGAPPIDGPIPFIAAIPTTAGTGSEVGRSAVISDDATKVKKIVYSPRLLPRAVFLDPELTLRLPAGITAATGMDALTHLIEAYLAKGHQPLCDGIAQEGIRIVAANLQRAVAFAKDPSIGTEHEHLQVRGAMLDAAMMGAVAFQKGLGVTHSCAHALSTVCDMHHGLANAILLPYTMIFNLQAVPQRFGVLAQCVSKKSGNGNVFIEWLEDLKDSIDIPRHLRDVNVDESHLDALVEHAFHDGCHQLNPRPVSKEDLRDIFSDALG